MTTIRTPLQIAEATLYANAVQPHFRRSGEQIVRLIEQAVEADRSQRDLYELIAEALDDRADAGADDGEVAANAAAAIRSNEHDHIWTSYVGPMLDELEEEFGTTGPKCDQCSGEATEFWPNLKEPVQLCDSCEHDARRSGWEPGR